MARSTPINSGYSVVSGTGTGTNGDRIDVWVEYKVISQSVVNNTSTIRAYFYAALKTGSSASTGLDYGLYSTFSVGGVAGTGRSNVGYNFTKPGVPCVVSSAVDGDGVTKNYLGRFEGTIAHNADGKKSVRIEGSFTTQSAFISGGNISATIALPAICSGLVHVETGSGTVACQAFIDNGTGWDQCVPHIDNVTGWSVCG